jgi:SNF2 family DNA or RNA helicase
MLSVKLSGTVLHVKLEGHLGGNDYKHLMNLFRNLPGAFYWEEKYTWIIPKQYVDDLLNLMGEDKIAWHNSIEEIKGIHETVIPQFNVSDEALSDLHLTPYPFQAVGISFLHDIKTGLLADEMGLGKTPQAIGAIHRLWKQNRVRKALVVCPTSLKYQWKEEISKFTDHKGIVIDGTPKQRKEQLYEFATTNEYLFGIINYELVRNDLDAIKEIKVDAIVADECHRIKNWKSKTSEAMKELDAPYKFGLTGTPMQNKPDELWNVMDWVDPTVLGNYWAFRNRYVVTGEKFGKRNVEIGYKRLGELRKRVAPKMLRRMKVDVAPELPEMIFNKYRVEMTPEQRKLQDAIQEDFMNLLKEIQQFSERTQGEYDENGQWVQPEHPQQGQMLGYFNLLLAVSNAPELLQMSDSGMAARYVEMVADKPKSPKLDELERICEENIESGNKKIVIFTQFARMQKLAIERLLEMGGVEMINGSMKPFERQAALDNFKYNETINFLVCTDAANYGLNMQFANVLVNLDIPWNPATYDQRAGRVHRIGGEHKNVFIIDIITQGGIDEKVEEALYRKRELAGQIVEKNDEERQMMNRLSAGLMNKIMGTKKKKK